MSNFKNGDKVTQVLPNPVTGVVSGFALDQQTGLVQAKVTWTDASGNVNERHFDQSELVATAE